MGCKFSWNKIIIFSELSFKYLLHVLDIFTKYTWIKSLKENKINTVLDCFIGIVNESTRKPQKLWIDQGAEFYNNLMQK